MKTGLILEGGAMRGLFTAGVLDVFMEQNIWLDGLVGVSAGACFGCNYKSKQIGRVIRYNERFCKDKRYCSFRSLLTTGDLFGADFCYRVIPDELDIFDKETFENNPVEFYITSTDIETGKPVYTLCKKGEPYLEWMRASASMPLAARMVEIDGKRYLDGGISDSIPLKFFESIGYEKNIVILTQPESYRKKENKMMPMIRRVYKKYPKLVETLTARHEMYNSTVAYIREQEQKGNAFVICPKASLPVGHVEHDKSKLRATYELGREAATEKLSEIKAFLEK